MPPDAEPAVFLGAANLEILHALEKSRHLLRLRIGVEAGAIEGNQQLVRGFKRGKAARLRLALDDISAGRSARKHDPRQPLQTEARSQHRSDEPPRGIEEENQQLTLPEFRVEG
jgi:hypothetical protein